MSSDGMFIVHSESRGPGTCPGMSHRFYLALKSRVIQPKMAQTSGLECGRLADDVPSTVCLCHRRTACAVRTGQRNWRMRCARNWRLNSASRKVLTFGLLASALASEISREIPAQDHDPTEPVVSRLESFHGAPLASLERTSRQ